MSHQAFHRAAVGHRLRSFSRSVCRFPGRSAWKLDLSQSDLGPEPAAKSVTVTVYKDTPEMLSWRVDIVDSEGKASSFSWSGPEDGTMHPVMRYERFGPEQTISCRHDE